MNNLEKIGTIKVGQVDGEYTSIIECECGKKYDPWDVLINDYSVTKMPCCGIELTFSVTVEIFRKIS